MHNPLSLEVLLIHFLYKTRGQHRTSLRRFRKVLTTFAPCCASHCCFAAIAQAFRSFPTTLIRQETGNAAGCLIRPVSIQTTCRVVFASDDPPLHMLNHQEHRTRERASHLRNVVFIIPNGKDLHESSYSTQLLLLIIGALFPILSFPSIQLFFF